MEPSWLIGGKFRSCFFKVGSFYCGDGDEVDEATKTALAQFQGAHGLPKTGAIDDATRGKLHSLHP
jgi:hypothetical protein